MEIIQSESYEIGLMLGALAKNLSLEINSFEKNYIGNLTRRIGTLSDFIKLKTDILDIQPAKISARNVLPGTVKAIEPGVVNDVVTVDLAGGDLLCSVITANSVKRLDLAPGKLVVGIIKASEVMLATE